LKLDLLSHINVAEVSNDITVRMCGRILADLGANVVRVSDAAVDAPGDPTVTVPDWLNWYLDHGKKFAGTAARTSAHHVSRGRRRLFAPGR
jgi:crotonobetainyl-CoA:carnitine CoA-transferase CaiB-like acyl-CoA transferase